ncbi:MAG: hypothetical protein BMS9Abin33_0414 [Gammaproteobacteria bacterium]|nr:MAG: hypothetical protein BMS9Abin33_0414 [Gammaproteobacteria bacterium]
MSNNKMHSNALLMLNLGCGDRTHQSWINIDYSLKARLKELRILSPFIKPPNPPGYLNYDLRRGIPFNDSDVDVVYASHVLEHLEKSHALPFMEEIYRVLKPNGVIRIVVPDLEIAVKDYLDVLLELRQSAVVSQNLADRYEWATILLLDQMVRTRPGGEMTGWLRSHNQSDFVQNMEGVFRFLADSGEGSPGYRVIRRIAQLLGLRKPSKTGELHRWMYDDISLERLFKMAGFSDVRRTSHTESRILSWEGYHLDNNQDGSAHQPGSIWMEGTK